MSIEVKVNTTIVDDQLTPNAVSNALARASDGRLWAVYREKGANVGEDVDVLAARSDDNGLTWTEEVAANEVRAMGSGGYAILINSADVPIVLYITRPASGNHKVWYMDRSGGSWGTPEEVIQTGTTNTVALCACIDSGDNIHIAYQEGSGGAGVVYVKGTSGSWGSGEVVSANAQNPCIAVDSSNQPYVAYRDNDDTYLKMRYKTASWQAEETVHSDGAVVWPTIALDSSDNVYVAFIDLTGDDKIYYNKRTAGSWGASVLVGTPASGENFSHPLITIDTTDNVYFIYQEYNVDIIYYKKLTAAGSLGSQQTLTEDITPPPSFNPSTYAGLWAKFPSSCRLGAVLQPVVLLLHKPSAGVYDLYYVRADTLAVTTQDLTDIAGTTATGNGNITALGNVNPTAHGVCWRTSPNPTTADEHTDEGAATATGAFTSSIKELIAGTTYYVRAYATDEYGTSYGGEVTFTTLTEPTVTTDPASSVEKIVATLNGTLDDDGNEACNCGFEWGETTAYGTTTPTESKETGETFSQAISGLTPGKHYHFRAIATNSVGTTYGSDRGFFAKRKGGNPHIDQLIYQHVERMGR